MIVAVPRETAQGERRVALVPESVKRLVKAGLTVVIQSGAGEGSSFSDDAYKEAGAQIARDAAVAWGQADLLLKVQPPLPASGGQSEGHEADLLKPGTMLLASLFPTRNLDSIRKLTERKVTAFSTDAIPRTTRAQAMDTLSSMANIVGYKGVLLAAETLPKYFPMFMTAAGTTFAAKVFVIGAGVAGLQAIATAKRLGAQVTATDVRPEVKEQIESVGGKYVGVELKQSASAGGGYAGELSAEDKARQAQLLAEQCALVDVVITTALIGGVIAPKLISEDIVKTMKPGSVLVDLGAEGGGNCTLSVPGKTVEKHGVSILAPLNLPSSMAVHASTLFSRNLTNFLLAFCKDGKFNLDLSDDILKGCTITHDGNVLHGPTQKALQA